ncbi:hypothetical protein GBA52_007476 [Prunus armeniaca]|nr:hypothetical protein GBA52_007476 [Prunus armeniaca]
MAFTGTLDKCKACDKTVYVVDMLSLEGLPYHKSCFKCSHCKGFLSMSTYSSMDGVLYCKPHFEQLFKESGNFSKNFQPKSAEKQNEQLGPQQTLLHVLWNPRQVRNLLKDSLSTGEATEPAAAEAPPEPQPEPTTEPESKDQTDQPPPEES